MNAALLMARARGLGFDDTFGTLGKGDLPSGGLPPDYSTGGGSGGGSSSGGGFNWNALPGVIGQTLVGVFGHPQQTAAGGGLSLAQQQQILLAQQQGANRPNAPGVGLGIDGTGIRLSDGSHIGWLPIGFGIGALVLLQSKGFSRR
jgi:hypothetical protein